MTIQQATSNSPLSSTGLIDVTQIPSQSVFDEATLTRMAAEFFSALPNQSNHQGLNLDLPPESITHSIQRKDQFMALTGRAPSIANQLNINSDFAKHYVNPTADHPERRLLSSSPVIGGANLPDPFATSNSAGVLRHQSHEKIFIQDNKSFPSQNLATQHEPQQSPYYFLNDQSAQHSNLKINQPDSSNRGHLNQQNNGTHPLYAVDQLQLTEDRHIRSASVDQNDRPTTSASSFYFLNDPFIESGYSSKPLQAQLPVQQSLYQPLDIHRIRQDFPILQERINGKQLVWFDNAATTHKPLAVIERISQFYKHENSNIHRAAHELAARASDAYEHARNVVARFIGASSSSNIIFVRGTTEGINLIAKSWGKQNIHAGDEIIVSHLEHHANIVPWYQLTQETGAKLRVIPVDDTGQIRIDEFIKLLNPKTKLVSITQVSNALGTVTPTEEIIALAHAADVRVLIDGAQSVSHMPTNVSALNADFFVFSGHKVFGPTGIGAVYAKSELLDSMPVWEGGGNMIQDVTFEHVIYQPAPNKFEAGTGNIADAVGLGAALEYVESLGIHNIARYEHDLLEYGQNALSNISGLRLIGTAEHKASVMSFILEGYETEEVGRVLNQYGIAVRTGHHCAQPILRRFDVERTVRPSLAFYNTHEEIDLLVSVLHQLRRAKPLKGIGR